MSDAPRVLIVEDEVDIAEFLAIVLQRNGYEVEIAHDGLRALEIVEERQPLCVLLDVGLPGIDGGELSKRIRERHGDDVILIAVTGHHKDDERVASTFARVDHYLQKPIDLALLSKVLPPVA